MPEAAGALRAALRGLRRDLGAAPPEEVRDARDVEAVAGLFGPTRGRQNAGMARAISGRPGPGSADYRAAIRNVQRYRTGARQRRGLRRIARRIGGPLAAAAARIFAALFNRRSRWTITGRLKVSKDVRSRTIRAVLPEGAAAALMELAASDDDELLEDGFVAALAAGYSGVHVELEDVDSIDAEWVTGR